jgi:glycosyltransferase involved in cell wall biosynthesis
LILKGNIVKTSIVVTSYNHEKYIRQCLESILTQKGDFEMEIILGDDCSTDGTGQILEEYQKKYPEIVKKLQNEKNLGITKNLKRSLDACTGDYIAICEGDDYWTSDGKIQKQMQMLETHPEYSMCFSALTLYYQEEQRYTLFSDQVNFPKDELTIQDLVKNNYIGNFSCCMYRASIIHKLPASLFKMFTVDWMFNMVCSEMGKVGFIRESLSVYRKHAQGAWAGKSDIEQVSKLIELTKEYNHYFQFRYDDLFKENLAGLENWIAARNSKAEQFTPGLRFGALRNGWLGGLKRRPVGRKLNRHLRKLANFILPVAKMDLALFDDLFPHPQSAFRLAEYNAYLTRFPDCRAYSTGASLPAISKNQTFSEVLDEYAGNFPRFKNRVSTFPGFQRVKPRIAYCMFINNARWVLPLAERAGAGFVFTLYPGGGLQLRNQECDETLKRICSSMNFRKVITTQKVTRDYLLQNGICAADDIEFIYGGAFPCHVNGNDRTKRQLFGGSKDAFDLCFVAHKYMPRGLDKGYDFFVAVAKNLARSCPQARFHVVGPFSKEDLDVVELDDRINFYGSQKPEFFGGFYQRMDMILSPNASFILHPGAFDGFPTGCCIEAGMCGVAVMATDDLKQNVAFRSGEDIVIINRDVDEISQRVEYYYNHPQELHVLAGRGQASFRRVFDFDAQMEPRFKVMENLLRV